MKKYLFIIIAVSFLFSCKQESNYSVDVSKIKVELTLKRLDKDFFNYPEGKLEEHIKDLQKVYGDFFKLYNFKILRVGSSDDTLYPIKIKQFMKYCKKKNINKDVEFAYGNIKPVMDEINTAFKYYKHYFPDKKLPEIYTYISGYNLSVVTAENAIGISLDKYLGADYKPYEKLAIDKYRRERMHKAMIKVDAMKAQLFADYPYESKTDEMLENIIYDGKIQYALYCMLPEAADTLKWGYSRQKYDWAKHNEAKIWNHIIEKKLLFSTDKLEVKKYVGDGPFTTPFSKISAPRAAVYCGFRIIENYMKNNSDISLKQLMEEKDYRKIFTKSRYNPK